MRADSLGSCATREVKGGTEARQIARGEGRRGRGGPVASGDIALSMYHCALETEMATPADQGQLDPGGIIASTNAETATVRRGESDNPSRVFAAYTHDAGAAIAHSEGTVVPSSEDVIDKVTNAHRRRWEGNLPVPEGNGGGTGRVLAHVGHGRKTPIHATRSVNGSPTSTSPLPLSWKEPTGVQSSQHAALSEMIVSDKDCATIPSMVPQSVGSMPIAILERHKSRTTKLLLDSLPGSSRSYTPPSTTPQRSALFRPPKKMTATEDLASFKSRSMGSTVCYVPSDEDRGHLQSPPRLAAGRRCERWERWKSLRPRLDATENEGMVGHSDSEKHT